MSQLSRDLLAQADDLLGKDKKKPKQANVRRAASTAYYALFHFLADKVTRTLAGATNDVVEVRTWLARALEHSTMSKVCKFFGNANDKNFKSFASKLNFTSQRDLEKIARAFVELQELRHSADYDLSEPITRAEADSAVKQTENVFKLWSGLEKQYPKLLVIFCLSLLSGKTSSKR
ncbi:MAG TPA: hypothetical protein VGZ93_00780 [Candidatus Methylacidiphilales bacterium]|jgi:uncharacterized protein (UPF0332 family)|nr:hypothetical protein [Candidatus Methylacidiphilales bacterium]